MARTSPVASLLALLQFGTTRAWAALLLALASIACGETKNSPGLNATGGVAGTSITTGGATGAGSTGGAGQTGGVTGGTSAAGGTRALLMHADFQSRDVGAYTQAMVVGDFSGAATWNNGMDAGRSTIVDENGERFLRITYAATVYGPDAGGVQFVVPFGGTYEELYLAYRVRFAADFDFVRGGKLPGLVGGTRPTGCVQGDNGGFSARMMWRPEGVAVQYLYFPEKVNECGDDYVYRSTSGDVRFTQGQWHRVVHRLRMNTPGAHDGILQAWFDGTLVLDEQAFYYRVPGATFGIDSLYFSTFFGGSDATWAPASAQIADFDDFMLSEMALN